jgi:hypothetical protein
MIVLSKDGWTLGIMLREKTKLLKGCLMSGKTPHGEIFSGCLPIRQKTSQFALMQMAYATESQPTKLK